MKSIRFGESEITADGPAYVIAEIGHNHQGNLETAEKMIVTAAACGVNAVKFQKRDNRYLFTKAFYNKPYENENSYGATYGEHREFLEFGREDYLRLKKTAADQGVEFMATAFDPPSADFLAGIGIASFKLASGDITNTRLITHVARLGKPLFMSTGAATLDEIRLGYQTARTHNDQVVLLHCIAGYPAEYEHLNLRVIETLRKEFPDALIGYSGHDNGILAAVIAYMMGAVVIEKHFTLNHSWKGTDHKFSLEPDGMRKQVRDLRRVGVSLGSPEKQVQGFEWEARKKMGKGIYFSRPIAAGSRLQPGDLVLKTPAGDIPPFRMEEAIGRALKVDVAEEAPLSWDLFE